METIQRKIIGNNGRAIFVNGPRCMFMLKKGFKESDDGIQMEIDNYYIRYHPRPKKEPVMYEHELVKNLDTRRLIKTGKVTLKKVAKIFQYNPTVNKFYMFKIRESNRAIRIFTK